MLQRLPIVLPQIKAPEDLLKWNPSNHAFFASNERN